MKCGICGRELKSKESIDRGYGLYCYKKYLYISNDKNNLLKWLGDTNEN